MTDLSLAIRNYLAQDAGLRELLGRSISWDTWIFYENPINVKVENTGKCLLVINEDGTWTSPNDHNTMRFPRVYIDIWADPTRNEDRSVKVNDAKSKIERIQKLLDKHLHLTDAGTRQGMPYIWGTTDQVASKTGVVVAGSHRVDGPTLSPIRDTDGAYMGRMTYGVNVP